ncbi:hypothetical protein [Streptomyces sp. NPDC045470]|uniref:hypothetical protein n=1 Tax=Streptomyces sp. NPDC045470 TaxID=3155469 RepID=UPI0034045E04
MSQNETTEPSIGHETGTQILKAGSAVSSRAELMDFLEEVATIATLLQGALATAAWRGQICEGAPLDERPPVRDIEEKLSMRDLNGRTPGEAAFSLDILNTMHAAGALGDLANTAWTAGLAEDTRVQVDAAHAQRHRNNAERYKDFLGGVGRVLNESVPEDAREAVSAALRREYERVWPNRTDTSAADEPDPQR